MRNRNLGGAVIDVTFTASRARYVRTERDDGVGRRYETDPTGVRRRRRRLLVVGPVLGPEE